MDAGSALPILQFRANVRVARPAWWQTFSPGTVRVFPGRVEVSTSPAPGSRVTQTAPRVQVVKTRLALPGSNLHLVVWESQWFATAALLPSDLPQLRSALYDAGFTMEYRTQWLFTLGRVPAETATRHRGIRGRTVNIKRDSDSRDGHE